MFIVKIIVSVKVIFEIIQILKAVRDTASDKCLNIRYKNYALLIG